MPRKHDRDDEPEEQPKRMYDELRDYLRLLRFRFDFGAKHNAQVFWGKKQ